jgi:hypothetical protein
MCDRSLGLAVRREQINSCRRFRSAPRPLLACVDPEPSRLGSPTARIEYRDRRVIGKEMVGGEHVLAQPFVQSLEPPACAANPTSERRAAEIGAMTVEDLRLPIERKMIAVFADQHVREQRRRRQTASDQSLGRAGLHHLAAGAAGVFRAGGAHDTKLRWDPIQHLADALTNQMESAATAATDPVLYVEQNVFAWQMIGQRPASRRRVGFRCDLRLRFLEAANVAVEILQTECKLVGIDASELRPNCIRCSCLMMDLSRSISVSRWSIAAAMSRTRRCRSAGSEGRLVRSSCMSDGTRTR